MMANPTQGNWCHIWNEHMQRWEVVVAGALAPRVAIVVAPDDNEAAANARLLASSKKLLEFARQVASQCASCCGSAEIIAGDPDNERSTRCTSCIGVWDLIGDAEG